MINVYMQPSCPHCEHATAYLAENGIPYTTINIREDETALNFMRAEKHGTTPQLYVGTKLLVAGGNQGIRQMSRAAIIERVAELSA